MLAITEREARYALSGKVQVDVAYLGGERLAGKVGRDSENKVPAQVEQCDLGRCGRFGRHCADSNDVCRVSKYLFPGAVQLGGLKNLRHRVPGVQR